MKILKINRLTLINFKGITQTSATFAPGTTTISGDNGVGKSTMADAFSWLFFGKNAAGNDKFTVKTVDASGEVIPHLDHTVEAELSLIDQETGELEQIRARRTYVEEWGTDTGEITEKLTGHHVDYFWNDIPVKKAEFTKNVAETIPAGLFRYITDPYAFLTLPKDEMRARLTDIAGSVTPQDIAANNPTFAAILAKIGKTSIEDYKISLGAQRKRIADQIDDIPKLKGEATRATPATPDYKALEARQAELEKTIADIDAAAGTLAERNRLQYQQAGEIQKQIGEQEKKQSEALHAAEMSRLQANHAAQAKHNDLNARIRQASNRVKMADDALSFADTYDRQARSYTSQAEAKEAELVDFRAKFQEIFNQTYTPGALICPRYGHVCGDPTANTKGEEEFNNSQVKTLTEMQTRGRQLAADVDDLKKKAADQAEKYQAEKSKAEKERDAAKAELTNLQNELAALPPANLLPEIKPAELPEWKAAADQIESLRQRYNEIMTAPAGTIPSTPTNPDAKRHAQMELDDVKKQLGLREIIAKQEARQKELDAQLVALAQEKADVEKELLQVEAFSIAITTAAEAKVNQHFSLVKFRMFETQVNGKKIPACTPTVNGVAYRDVNTAGQINAGLDVIETLTRFYEYKAPIFVDNCESVATLREPEGAQIIRLQFVKGLPLTITPE